MHRDDDSFAASPDAGRQRTGFRRLYSLAVLPVEMPLLRFQQPCPPRARSTRRASCAPFRAEIAANAARDRGRTVTSIFFGGGTPSLMQPATVAGVLDGIARHWRVAADVEITLEANPTSVEAERFRGYRAAGVNRVSLGVQALDDGALKQVGPHPHGAGGARRRWRRAQRFRALFVRPDLCAARGKRRRHWAAELKRALAEAGEHLSLYQLTIEPETPFAALHAAGKLQPSGRGMRAPPLRPDAGDLRRRRAAGLRGLQPCAARRRMPAQSGLLAHAGICRHRPGRPWPARYRRPTPCHRDREAAGSLAHAGREGWPRPGDRRCARSARRSPTSSC